MAKREKCLSRFLYQVRCEVNNVRQARRGRNWASLQLARYQDSGNSFRVTDREQSDEKNICRYQPRSS